jgi:hypothetical protein
LRFRYDASSKWLIENHADAILRLAGVTGVVSFKALPGEVVQSRQLPDGLVEVRLAGRPDPALFLIEINTYPDNRVPGELLDDLMLTYLNRRQLPELVTLVLCPKGNLQVNPRAEVVSPLGWSRLEAGWRVVNLWELSAADFLPLTDPGLAPWVPLTRLDVPAEQVIQQCKDVIEANSEGGQKANLLAVTEILSGLVHDERMLETILRGGFGMIESPVLKKWLRESEVAAYQSMLLGAVSRRFGTVPPDVSATVRLITDHPRLELLLDSAYSAATLDDFRAALTQ